MSFGSKMALIVFCTVIFGIIAEGFHNIFAASCTMFCVKYFAKIIIRISVNHHSAVIFRTSNQQFWAAVCVPEMISSTML